MQITKRLRFEDNEVTLFDAEGNILEAKTFKSPALAKAAFEKRMQELNLDFDTRIEFESYIAQFPPQQIAIWEKE